MQTIYVAGPYTATTPKGVEDNVTLAIDTGIELMKLGWYPFIPHLTHYIELRNAEHALSHVDLVGQLLDRVGVERDQPIEARDERDPLRFAPQFVPGALGGRFFDLFD